MEILKIKIYQPQAHYRIPFSFSRRHTHALPPYSTFVGFFCNLLGIWNQNDEIYSNGISKLKIAVSGKFDIKLTEYIWFRNLSEESHKKKFGYISNRFNNGHIEHIGGQSPIKIDILNNVYLNLYLAHSEESFLGIIKDNLVNPVNRLEVLHIGRAEDWIVLIDEPKLLKAEEISFERRDADYKHFFWIPEKFYIKQSDEPNMKFYGSFENFNGLLHNLQTTSRAEGFEESFNRNAPRRFKYVKAKLNDGILYNQEMLLDKSDASEILPIFLTNLDGGQNDYMG